MNDAFAEAQILVGGSGQPTGTNVLATREAGEPDHANAGGNVGLVPVDAPRASNTVFHTGGSGYDTALAVSTGTAVNALTLIGANDDGDGFGLQSRVEFIAVAGTEYRLAIDGFNGASGQIVLNWNTSLLAASDLRVAALGPDVVRMTWSDNASTEDGFWVFLDGNYTPPNVAANTTAWDVPNLQPGARYCFRVSSFNSGGGSDLSAEACTSTTTPGSALAWGTNSDGQLGNGGTVYRTVAQPVVGPDASTAVFAVAAGGWHTLLLKADGSVFATGYDGWGELGDGTMTARSFLTPVVGLGPGSDVVAIAAGTVTASH